MASTTDTAWRTFTDRDEYHDAITTDLAGAADDQDF